MTSLRPTLALALGLFACGGSTPPPPAPSTSTTTPSSADAGGGGALDEVIVALEMAINAGDEAAANTHTTAKCREKECLNLAGQKKGSPNFRVKRDGDVEKNGIHAAITFRLYCDGEKVCEKLTILLAQDCASSKWVVEDTARGERKHGRWVNDAPAACQ